MKKQLLIPILFLFFLKGYTQIGINTTTPNAMLDISSTTNGLLIPRIALTADNVVTPVVNPQGGAVAISTMIYNTATVAGVNGVSPGYYYWSGTLWIPFTGTPSNDWELIGNTATNDPATPITYGTSTIATTENFVGTTDANDVVVGTNTIERFRVKQTTGNVGIGTATPANKLHVASNVAGATTALFENTFVGNTTGVGLLARSTNNPGFGTGGIFQGNAIGISATNSGSATTGGTGGIFFSNGIASTATRTGISTTASNGSVNFGIVSSANGSSALENIGGTFFGSGSPLNRGGQFSANGPASSLNMAVQGSTNSDTNSTNYAGNFTAASFSAIGTTNYAGHFAATGGNRNYAIVVPNNSGTIGFGTITPNAMLEISSGTNGVLLPRIALTANNVAAPVVNPQGGALIVSTMIYNTATVAGVNGVSPGYYYWSGTLWTPFTSTPSNDWKLNGNTTITEPAIPVTYGTSTIASLENFIGTTDANDVVIGTNNIERFRVKKASGNVGIGIATPSNKLHIATNTAAVATTFSENTFVGNSNGIGIEGRSTNNPAFGIGGKFTGNAYGIQAINTGSIGATTYGGDFTSTGPASTGNRYGINAAADGGTINTGGALIASGATSSENFGGFFTALNGPKNIGSQSQGTGPANSLNGGVFATAGGGNNSTNYGGNFNAQTTSAIGTTNYGGFFAASGGNRNYGIVVPSGGGTVGLGTITPSAMLDVASGTNGVLLPRIALTANNVAAPVVNPQGGALPTSTLIYNTATVVGVNGVSPGYYYWNGTLWTPFSGTPSNDWRLIGNTAINDPTIPVTYGTSTIAIAENFVGTTDANDVVIGTNNLERLRVKQTTGNVGIGTANPSNTLHVVSTQTGVPTSFFQNTSVGNFTGTGVFGVSVNNPGYGTGGAFIGGLEGVTGQVNLSTSTGITTGVRGRSTGDGGVTATRVGGDFFSQGVNFENYGGKFLATGGTTNYGGNFEASGVGTISNYGGNFTVSGGSTGNWAGVFTSTGGSTSTGADFFANNGTLRTTAGYFQAIGSTINYGTRAIVSNGAINYGGSFVTNGFGTATNYSGYFIANGGTNNYAGYFSATGGTNDYAIVVPSNSGDVGIGTSTPLYKLHVSNSITNVPTAYVENNANFSGIGIEGRATGINSGIGGKFTGSGIGVTGTGVSILGGTSPKGGVFSASTTATTNYGITADASGGINSNYAGFFTATGNTTTNVGGYFSATGAPFNNYAIIVPANEGRVGIGTSAPVDQLEVAGGFVRSTGYRCRTGTAGTYPGNVFNINWTGTTAQLWIDTFNIGTFQFTSDRRLKENIIKMSDNALSRVMQLKPVYYNYKNIPNTIFSGSDIVTEGFIADELQEVIPSAVNGDKNALTTEGIIQPQTINTNPIVSVLTKAIQEQQIIIENLQIKNNQLEERLKRIEQRLDSK